MRLTDLMEKEEQKGTYAGVKFNEESQDLIVNLAKEIGVPNPITKGDIHLTLLYSRKFLPDYKAAGDIDIKVTPKDFHIFVGFDKKEILVMKIDAPDLIKRHKELMKEHGATYDFPEYIPHITLSYDIDGFMGLQEIKDKFTKILPKELHITNEYSEDLELEWKQKG